MSEKDYSSDSDAPEEVSQVASKALAVREFKQRQAVEDKLKEKSKAKRRAEIERNIDQKKAKKQKQSDSDSLQAIPDDLLSAVAAVKRGDISILPEDNTPKRKVYTRQENIIVNDLETAATSFKVIKFDEIDKPLVDQAKEIDSIHNFKNTHFFHTNAIKRSKAWQVSGRKMKRKF